MDKKLTNALTTNEKQDELLAKHEKLGPIMSNVTEKLVGLNERIRELDNVWLFFQRFVDEQGNDFLKIIRGPAYNILQKLNAIEWLARYIEFITPDSITMGANFFKQIYAQSSPTASQVFRTYQHTSEAVPTIV